MLNWTVNRFIYDTSYKIGDRKHQLKSDKLISKNLLEDYVKELENKTTLENLSTHSRNVFTKLELLSYLNALNIHLYGKIVKLSDLDYDILLTYLERDVNKVKFKGDIVKFGTDEVTEEDESIAEIKSTLKSLNSKTEELQQKLDNVSLRLKESLRNKNNKDLSLNLLRSKKLAEKSLSTQLSLTNQLESVMYKIDESSSNVQLLKALENGTVILKSLNSQIGGVERVEKIMDDLEEETYQNDKIAAEFNRLDTQVDDSEIEAEFEEMLSQEKGRQKPEHYTESSENELVDKLQELKLAPNEIDPKSEKKVEKEALHN